MSGTTVPLGLPYPTDIDYLTNGDEAIQALAEAVNGLLTGGDAALTLNAIANFGEGCRSCKRGRMVTLQIAATFTSGFAAGGNFAQLTDATALPPRVYRGVMYDYTNSLPKLVKIDTAGLISADQAIATGAVLLGCFTYPLPA